MCMCKHATGQHNINGQPGYCWNDATKIGVRHVSPPDLENEDELLFDEPGRCGGLDGHSHHFRLVKRRFGGHAILVRHGGGDDRIDLDCVSDLVINSGTFDQLDTHARYWLLYSMYSVHRAAAKTSRDKEAMRWRQAAADKRIKTRKQRGGDHVKVWIEPQRERAIA